MSYPCSRANCFARSVETCLLSSKSALFPQRTFLDFSFEIMKNKSKKYAIRFTKARIMKNAPYIWCRTICMSF